MKKTLFLTLSLVIFNNSFVSADYESNNNNTLQKRVLIGSPIYQKPNILKEFLNSLLRLDKVGLVVDYYLVDDNELAESSNLLNEFIANSGKDSVIVKKERNSAKYICNEATHYWSDELVQKVAGFKNEIINHAASQKYDYLFLLDSDMVIHPATLKHLISVEKDIVSTIFWTSWQPNTDPLPNAWLYDLYTLYPKKSKSERLSPEEANRRTNEFLNQLKQPGTYEVGGLCASTLVSRNALEKGVSFGDIKNITLWGEDRYFCIRAIVLGLKLFVDTHYPAFHIYRESDLSGVPEYIEKNC